jgi:hypothetical protein
MGDLLERVTFDEDVLRGKPVILQAALLYAYQMVAGEAVYERLAA